MDRLALMVMGTRTQQRNADVMRYLRSTIDLLIQTGRVADARGIVDIHVPPLDHAEENCFQ